MGLSTTYYLIKFEGIPQILGFGVKIGGRDSPHEVFNPWVRWDLGLDRIRSFRVVALSCRRVVALSCRY